MTKSERSCLRTTGFIGVIAISLTLLILWTRFGPLNSQTPPALTLLIVVLSITSTLIWLIIDITDGTHSWKGFLAIFILLACATLASGRTRNLVEEILGDSDVNFANIMIAWGIISGILFAGQSLSSIGEEIRSHLWEVFQSHVKKRSYVIAIGLLLLTVITFLLFLLFEALGG